MFECDMSGCFDSATHHIKFLDEEKEYQICDSCEDYWKHDDDKQVESIKKFANN
jgi:hypothetical protein